MSMDSRGVSPSKRSRLRLIKLFSQRFRSLDTRNGGNSMNNQNAAQIKSSHQTVAVIVADDFEDSELMVPLKRLEAAGV